MFLLLLNGLGVLVTDWIAKLKLLEELISHLIEYNEDELQWRVSIFIIFLTYKCQFKDTECPLLAALFQKNMSYQPLRNINQSKLYCAQHQPGG